MSESDRLGALEARNAIAGLVHAYARFVRYDMPEEVHTLFAPDGWFEIRDGHPDKPEFTVRARLESPQAINDYLVPGKGKPHPIPLIHNLMIEVDGDTATGNAAMEGQIFGTDQKVFGEYFDTFRVVGGEWRFASRIFTIFNPEQPAP